MRRRLAAALLIVAVCAALAAAAAHRRRHAFLYEGVSFSKGAAPAADGKLRLWTPLSQVSPVMLKATLLQEQDSGKAAWARRVAALRPEKGGLAARASRPLTELRLRLLYSREELLEAYLNLAPYGGRAAGIGAASRLYYEKSPDQLNLEQALTLSSIPRRPIRGKLARWLYARLW